MAKTVANPAAMAASGYQLSSIDPVKDGLVASLKGDGLFGGEVEAAGYRGRA
jgi:hypothetical protein